MSAQNAEERGSRVLSIAGHHVRGEDPGQALLFSGQNQAIKARPLRLLSLGRARGAMAQSRRPLYEAICQWCRRRCLLSEARPHDRPFMAANGNFCIRHQGSYSRGTGRDDAAGTCLVIVNGRTCELHPIPCAQRSRHHDEVTGHLDPGPGGFLGRRSRGALGVGLLLDEAGSTAG